MTHRRIWLNSFFALSCCFLVSPTTHLSLLLILVLSRIVAQFYIIQVNPTTSQPPPKSHLFARASFDRSHLSPHQQLLSAFLHTYISFSLTTHHPKVCVRVSCVLRLVVWIGSIIFGIRFLVQQQQCFVGVVMTMSFS